jgi:hypothetical protein
MRQQIAPVTAGDEVWMDPAQRSALLSAFNVKMRRQRTQLERPIT